MKADYASSIGQVVCGTAPQADLHRLHPCAQQNTSRARCRQEVRP